MALTDNPGREDRDRVYGAGLGECIHGSSSCAASVSGYGGYGWLPAESSQARNAGRTRPARRRQQESFKVGTAPR